MLPPLPVLIDTDPAIGLPGRDVDDGLALLQACKHAALDVRGVTAVFGNAEIDDTYRLAQEVLAVGGHGAIPVARGAAGSHELGRATPASTLLIERLREGPHTLLALGPLTNIATAVRLAPDIAANIPEIVFVGGRRPGVEFLVGRAEMGLMDLNFELDPEAARVLLEAGLPLVYAGFELSAQVAITRADVETLRACDTPVTGYLVPHLTAWIDYWQEMFGVEYFFPFDTLAVGYLTDRDLIAVEHYTSGIEVRDGRPYLHASAKGRPHPVTFCSSVAAEPFRTRLLALLT